MRSSLTTVALLASGCMVSFPDPPPCEAGPVGDAAPPDTAPVGDAPLSDAGRVRDAALSDAGRVRDAALSDAGPIGDGGSPDTAPVGDASLADAGPVGDSGPPDAALADAAPVGECDPPGRCWVGAHPALTHDTGRREGVAWAVEPAHDAPGSAARTPVVRGAGYGYLMIWVQVQVHAENLDASDVRPVVDIQVDSMERGRLAERRVAVLAFGEEDQAFGVEFLAWDNDGLVVNVVWPGVIGMRIERVSYEH